MKEYQQNDTIVNMSINTLLQLLAVSVVVVMRNCKRLLQMGRDMDVVMATNTIFSNLKEETIAIETPTRQIALPDFNDWARGYLMGCPMIQQITLTLNQPLRYQCHHLRERLCKGL